MANTIYIHITDAIVHAYIGIYDIEQQQAQPIKISIKATINVNTFEQENIDTTLNYEKVWHIVEQCLQQKWQLLESAAETIAHRIKLDYPNTSNISVTLMKLKAPIVNFNGTVGITYNMP
jgi:7,8-dihydroneopterin aldolase/epimerase/oxygenase